MRKNLPTTWVRTAALPLLACLLLPFAASAGEHEEAPDTFDGLVQLEDTRVYSAFIDPKADFSVFRRVAVLEPTVAFRSNWQRDVNRSRSQNVRASDVERIKADVAQIFKDVFTEELEAAGYEIANYTGEDVLLLRPAIIDLDIAAPDVRRGGRSRTYTAATGAATLVLELFDSLSFDIVGRAFDRRTAGRSGGFATASNRVTNRSDARREFRAWARMLVEFLDAHYAKAEVAAESDE
jgi:hypothetical protein